MVENGELFTLFLFLTFIAVQLIYKVVLVSGENKMNQLALHVHTSTLAVFFPHIGLTEP